MALFEQQKVEPATHASEEEEEVDAPPPIATRPDKTKSIVSISYHDKCGLMMTYRNKNQRNNKSGPKQTVEVKLVSSVKLYIKLIFSI